MALNGLFCADVLLRNYSPIHSLTHWHWLTWHTRHTANSSTTTGTSVWLQQSSINIEVCTVMGTTFTVIRGDGVTSHGVTMGMGSNGDGNTAVKCET